MGDRIACGCRSGCVRRQSVVGSWLGRFSHLQDRRKLRRYARRWIVERFFAWMQWKRRLLVRWEYYPANFLGSVQLAALSILLKGF